MKIKLMCYLCPEMYKPVSQLRININREENPPSKPICNLGVIFDSKLHLESILSSISAIVLYI